MIIHAHSQAIAASCPAGFLILYGHLHLPYVPGIHVPEPCGVFLVDMFALASFFLNNIRSKPGGPENMPRIPGTRAGRMLIIP